MSSETIKLRVQCLTCMLKTNHEVLHEVYHEGSTPDKVITWWSRFEIIRCRGCETLSFRKTSGSSEDFDFETGEPEIAEELYPGRTAGKILMEGHEQLPTKTYRVYKEVIQALNNNAPILAAIGLRALIESICLEQETTAKNLMGCIDELADMGPLAKYQAEFLHTHRFLGNVAAHEMKSPKPQELNAALDIAETLLKTIYVLPHTAKSIHTGKKKTTS